MVRTMCGPKVVDRKTIEEEMDMMRLKKTIVVYSFQPHQTKTIVGNSEWS